MDSLALSNPSDRFGPFFTACTGTDNVNGDEDRNNNNNNINSCNIMPVCVGLVISRSVRLLTVMVQFILG